MRPRLSSLAGFLLSLAAAMAWTQAEVTFSARVDARRNVYVDVENAGSAGIRVIATIVAFYDHQQTLIEKKTFRCRDDCFVDGKDRKSLGPLKGSRDFDAVKAIDVLYKENDAVPVEPGDRPPAKPTPSSRP